MGQGNYANGFQLTLQPRMLELPLSWKNPQSVFVNSMSGPVPQGRVAWGMATSQVAQAPQR